MKKIILNLKEKVFKRIDVILVVLFLVAGLVIGGNTSQNIRTTETFDVVSNNVSRSIQVAPQAELAEMVRTQAPAKSSGFVADINNGHPNLVNPEQQSNRKIQETHNITLQGPNKSIKSLYNKSSEICSIDFCYIQNGNININAQQSVANLTIKLNHGTLNDYLDKVLNFNDGLEITQRSRSAVDRTAQFQDIKARKESQEALRERLVKLVSTYRGNEVRSLLEIERELARVQGKIESMDAQLRSISDVTDKTTLNLRIQGKIEYAPTDKPSPVMKAINSSWNVIAGNIAVIITITASLLPWIGAAGLLYLLIKFVRYIRKVFIKI
jgi:hypothetical protein